MANSNSALLDAVADLFDERNLHAVQVAEGEFGLFKIHFY